MQLRHYQAQDEKNGGAAGFSCGNAQSHWNSSHTGSRAGSDFGNSKSAFCLKYITSGYPNQDQSNTLMKSIHPQTVVTYGSHQNISKGSVNSTKFPGLVH